MHGLGELETAVMDVLWQASEPLPVRAVLERLDTGRRLAYTTVMTVLDNLHRKQWVSRAQQGRAYHYRPEVSREEAAARAVRAVLDSSGNPSAVLMHFVASASEEEGDALRRALRRRRR
jgi:predicted transcriptional regulator